MIESYIGSAKHFENVFALASQHANGADYTPFIKKNESGCMPSKIRNLGNPEQIKVIDQPELKMSASCKIFTKVSDLLEKDKIKESLDYLDNEETLAIIKKLSHDEQSQLTQMFLAHPQKLFPCFTKSGQYLVAKPTSDQYLIGLIGSLMKEILGSVINGNSFTESVNHQWEQCQIFKENNATHLPCVFSENLPIQNLRDPICNYYGFRLKNSKARPTKNVSTPCDLCLIHQTDQREHDKIFHPNGFIALGIDEDKTKLIYSADLLKQIDLAEYTIQNKKRLLPPVIFQMYGQEAINFAALNESALLLPDAFLSRTMCQFIEAKRDYWINDFSTSVARKLPTPEEQKAMIDCYQAIADFSTNIPVLAQIGDEIQALLNAKDVPIPSGSISDRYNVKKFASDLPWNKIQNHQRNTLKSLLARNAAQRRKVHPYLAGKKTDHSHYFFSREATRGMLRQAMNNVSIAADSNVLPGSAPVFIGFIPPMIADKIANQHGFLDSNWSGNFLHGKYSHALALTCLTKLANLNQGMLKSMVDRDLWSPILDENPYYCIDIGPETDNLPFLQLNGNVTFNLFAHSPFKFHQLLTTGQLSTSLNEIKEVILLYGPEKQAELLKRFATRMGMKETLTLDRLMRITENIRVLELVLSTRHLYSMEQVTESRGTGSKDSNELYDPADLAPLEAIGNFHNTDRTAELTRIKAEKYFKKGYKIQGVKGADSQHPEVLEITSVPDIEQCDAFIAFPPHPDPATEERLP